MCKKSTCLIVLSNIIPIAQPLVAPIGYGVYNDKNEPIRDVYFFSR